VSSIVRTPIDSEASKKRRQRWGFIEVQIPIRSAGASKKFNFLRESY